MGLLEAAAEVAAFLEERRIPYAFIGGLALQQWGEPRLTRDVDATVLVAEEELPGFVQEALSRFRPRIADAAEFALHHRVLLMEAKGVPVDLSLGIAGYEEEALRRAVQIPFPGVGALRLLAAEDLIIHKCVAGRPRDLEDVTGILIRQRLVVDAQYIRHWLAAFREVVETHDPLQQFEASLNEARKGLERSSIRPSEGR